MSYPDSLSALWSAHLAPRTIDAPTVISVFAGCGGSSLGYSAAGYKELLAVEWDDNAATCFRANFPEVDLHHDDICQLSVDEILTRCNLQVGELDVLDGSPPCQGFSLAGSRKLDDGRNQLFMEFVRLLSGLRPKTFVMENVSGMVKGSHRLIFKDILTALKSAGYLVSAKLLNAMYYGVPQARERMIFIGIRSDLDIAPSHPAPFSTPISVRQAWAGLPEPTEAEIRPLSPAMMSVAALMRATDMGKAMHLYRPLTGRTGSARSAVVMDWEKPSRTIVRSEIAASGFIHPDRRRYVTVSETKRLCSFPDEFLLPGTRKENIARLGNSVPPLLALAIGRHIRTTILSVGGVT